MNSKQKACVYIDGSNMFYAQQKMGWFIDWKKIKIWLEDQFNIVEIKYYTGKRLGDIKSNNFNIRLQNYGYKIYSKQLKKILIDKNSFVYKANFDVEIAVDMILEKDLYDYALLFSGDSDFEYVIKKLHHFNKKIIVCCSRKAMSKELFKVSDKYYLLGKIRKDIEYN